MKKLSYKTLLIVFCFLLIGVIILLRFFIIKPNPAAAGWWNDAWHYRKAVSITNGSGSNLTDFQVSISVGTSQLIADGKMQNDCDDIRIVDQNGNQIPYWIEENNPGCNSPTGDTKIWTKASSLPTSGSVVYVYYGNSTASNNENGDNVFEFFDDFENGVSKWTLETGVTTSIITESNSKILNLSNNSTWKGAFAGNEDMSNYYYEARVKSPHTRLGLYIRHKSSNDTDNGYYLRTEADNFGYSQNDGALGAYGTYTLDTNIWYKMKILAVGTSASLFINDVNQNINQVIQNNTGNIGISPIDGTNNAYYDYVFVRKYASTDPTSSLQSEEAGGGPIAYWKFDEGSGTTVYDSAGSNNGTISGATWQTEDQCLSGKCLYFNGVNSLSVNNSNILDNTNSISISIWVKPTTTSGIISIINRSGFTGPDNGYSFEIQDGKPTVLINNGRVANSTQKCNQSVDVNKFTHLEWTRNNSNDNKIFINGKECTYSSTINVSQVSVNTTLGIGSKLNKQNIAPHMDYSNRTYNSPYTATSWGGDAATITYYSNGGYNGLPYKVLDKGSSGTGGSYLDDNGSMMIEDNKTYIISAWMKANQNVSLNAYSMCINRTADNAYRTGGGVGLTTDWQKKFWVYNSGVGHSGSYYSRHIIYDDTDLPLNIYWSGFTIENVTGTGKTNPSSDFSGFIDDVKIYPYARTADQIKLDYNSRGSSKGSSVNLGIQSNTIPSTSSSLAAHWKFDEGIGTSVFDSSINETNGYFSGATKPIWTTGKYNSGIAFSGVNDSLVVPYRPAFRDAFTVSIWIKRTTDYNQLADVMLLSPPNAWYFYDSYNSGSIRGDVYIDGTRRAGLTVPIPFDGNWYHVAYTYDSATHFSKMYKNGTLYSSAELTGLANYLVDSATGNIYNMGLNSKGRGIILDEPRIYNRALTADEIRLDYNQKSATTFGTSNQTIGGTTTSLEYCIPGDTSYCASPVAEYNFEENTGTTLKDTSGNNNNGTFGSSSAAPTWTIGKKGAGLNFDGNDSVTIPDNDTLDPGENITVEAWFNLNDLNGTNTILAKKSSNDNYWMDIRKNGAQILVGGYASDSSGCYSSTVINTLNTNIWYHLTFTYNRQNMITYLNGQRINSENKTCILNSDNSSLYFGTRAGSSFFKGKLDGVKIYNYARTPAQIAYDYNKGAPVGWWKLDECQGNIANDSSGVGNSGVIVIGSSGTQNSLGTCQIGTSAAWTNGASGKVNSSLNFDGNDDYINIGKTIPFTSSISMSAWVFPTSNPFTYYGGFLSTENHSTLTGISMWFKDNKFYFGQSHNSRQYSDNVNYDLNHWYHTVLIYDNSSYSFYLNGKRTKLVTGVGTTLNNTVVIGRLLTTYNTSYYFPGQLDDVRIYNYALTAEQIKTIYNNGAINFN